MYPVSLPGSEFKASFDQLIDFSVRFSGSFYQSLFCSLPPQISQSQSRVFCSQRYTNVGWGVQSWACLSTREWALRLHAFGWFSFLLVRVCVCVCMHTCICLLKFQWIFLSFWPLWSVLEFNSSKCACLWISTANNSKENCFYLFQEGILHWHKTVQSYIA